LHKIGSEVKKFLLSVLCGSSTAGVRKSL